MSPIYVYLIVYLLVGPVGLLETDEHAIPDVLLITCYLCYDYVRLKAKCKSMFCNWYVCLFWYLFTCASGLARAICTWWHAGSQLYSMLCIRPRCHDFVYLCAGYTLYLLVGCLQIVWVLIVVLGVVMNLLTARHICLIGCLYIRLGC